MASSVWELLSQWCEIEASEPYSQVLSTRVMPGAKWFAGAKLNYAHHALRHLEDDAEVLVEFPKVVHVSRCRVGSCGRR